MHSATISAKWHPQSDHVHIHTLISNSPMTKGSKRRKKRKDKKKRRKIGSRFSGCELKFIGLWIIFFFMAWSNTGVWGSCDLTTTLHDNSLRKYSSQTSVISAKTSKEKNWTYSSSRVLRRRCIVIKTQLLRPLVPLPVLVWCGDNNHFLYLN